MVTGMSVSTVCKFPIAAITNYPKLSSLNNTNLSSYSFIGQKFNMDPSGLKSRWQQGCVPSSGSKGESISTF